MRDYDQEVLVSFANELKTFGFHEVEAETNFIRIAPGGGSTVGFNVELATAEEKHWLVYVYSGNGQLVLGHETFGSRQEVADFFKKLAKVDWLD